MYVLPVLDPSLTTNVGGQSVQAGKMIGKFLICFFCLFLLDWFFVSNFLAVSSVIEVGDLELPSADEEDEVQVEQTPAEAVLSGRRKRKGPAPSPNNTTRLGISGKLVMFQLFLSNLF